VSVSYVVNRGHTWEGSPVSAYIERACRIRHVSSIEAPLQAFWGFPDMYVPLRASERTWQYIAPQGRDNVGVIVELSENTTKLF
jgi:hypothetical protein